jgi:hypothetical protein
MTREDEATWWQRLTTLLGDPPDFHDGEITAVSLSNDGSSWCKIYVDMYNSNGDRMYSVELGMSEVVDANIQNWRSRNVIREATIARSNHGFELRIEPIPAYGPIISVTSANMYATIVVHNEKA